MGVMRFDTCLCLMTASLTNHIDIELIGIVLFELDIHAVLGNEPFAFFHGLTVTVTQHLQFQLWSSDQSPQCNGNGQSDHSSTGNPHAHGIFQDIGTESDIDLFWSATQQGCCLCYT